MRKEGVQYLVGTPKERLAKVEKELLPLAWKSVREGIEVKLLAQGEELLVLARSDGRRQKEKAIRRKRLKKLFNGLLRLRRSCPKRDALLERLGALKSEAGRTAKLVEIHVPRSDEAVTRDTFHYHLRVNRFKAAEGRFWPLSAAHEPDR